MGMQCDTLPTIGPVLPTGLQCEGENYSYWHHGVRLLWQAGLESFSYWKTSWRPAVDTMWHTVSADGDCFWHSLAFLLDGLNSDRTIMGLKSHVLCQSSELLRVWVQMYGGSFENLQSDLSYLAKPQIWADWRAVGLSSFTFDKPIVVWEKDLNVTTVFCNPQTNCTTAWLLRLSKDHFSPSMLEAPFWQVMSDQHGAPELACKIPMLTGGAIPVECNAELMGVEAVEGQVAQVLDEQSRGVPLSITTLNVTSLKKHLRSVLSMDTHLIVATETRVGALQQPDCQA